MWYHNILCSVALNPNNQCKDLLVKTLGLSILVLEELYKKSYESLGGRFISITGIILMIII